MREVRAERAAGAGPLNGVALRARTRQEDLLTASGGDIGRSWRGLALMGRPRRILGRGLGDHGKRHQRMLVSAKLSALAPVRTSVIGPEFDRGITSWNHVFLAVQTWHPKCVDDVRRDERNDHRPSYGNVKLICKRESRQTVLWPVACFPPPLVAGQFDMDGI